MLCQHADTLECNTDSVQHQECFFTDPVRVEMLKAMPPFRATTLCSEVHQVTKNDVRLNCSPLGHCVLDPLRQYSLVGMTWHWSHLHEDARQGLKLALASSSTFLEGFEKHGMEPFIAIQYTNIVRQPVLCQHILKHRLRFKKACPCSHQSRSRQNAFWDPALGVLEPTRSVPGPV